MKPEDLGKRELDEREILDMRTSELVGVVAAANMIGILAAQGRGPQSIPKTLNDNMERCARELDDRVPSRG